uniref:Mu transposase domain-containing protein n=1 Tax=Marinimicrobium locisalis TaxID=546022 RepID=UPI003D30092D
KQDALYGETFESETALRQHLQHWLETVANARTHGTTGREPRAHFESDERAHLRPYLVPSSLLDTTPTQHRRRADKTGLISWKANKYSVPLRWQRAQVGVAEHHGQLHIHDLETGERIARHTLSLEKGRTIKNNHHYRDPTQRINELEQAITEHVPAQAAATLCRLLKLTSPRIYKDQLVGVRDLLNRYGPVDAELLAILTQQTRLTASAIQNYLEAWQQARERGREPDIDTAPGTEDRIPTSALQAYAQLGRSSGQEVTHESA